MSITAIGNSSNTLAAELQAITLNPFATSANNDASTSAPTATGGDSRFVAAIKNAFESLGISLDGTSSTSATTSTSTSSTTDGSTTDDAVASFMQSLFAALHSQPAPNGPPPSIASTDGTGNATATATATSAANGTTSTSTDATSGTSGTGAAHHHHGHGGHRVDSDLQSLLAQLQASDGTSTTAGTSTSSTSSTALDTLEKNFNALLAQNGVASTGTNDQLATFLENLASNLDGAPKTGNVVSTTA